MEDEKETLDSLPEDLEASFSSPDYEIPNNDRRRIAAFLYLIVGVVAVIWRSDNNILVVDESCKLVDMSIGIIALQSFGFDPNDFIDTELAIEWASNFFFVDSRIPRLG